MTKAAVVNAFLTARVLLVGGFLLALPHITRKGLLFGVCTSARTLPRETPRAGSGSAGIAVAWR